MRYEMPTISKPKKAVQIGNSRYILVGSDYFRGIQQITNEEDPRFRVVGDTVLVVIPEGIDFSKSQLTELLKQVSKIPVINKSKTKELKKEKKEK
jgi:hypothetical protein